MITITLEELNRALEPLGVEVIVEVPVEADGVHKGTRFSLVQAGQVECGCVECQSSGAIVSYAGKLGPWARRGCQGDKYLKDGLQRQPVYVAIAACVPEEGQRYWWTVHFEDGTERAHVWCGTHVYEYV